MKRLWLMACIFLCGWLAKGEVELQDWLYVFGDAQLRLEVNDSTRAGQADQSRLRLTSHLGLRGELMDGLNLTVRGRTGSAGNQHSPTITLWEITDDTRRGDRDVYVDLWNLSWKTDGLTLAGGRIRWPFRSVTDYVWDRDVNPAGGFASWRLSEGDHEWTVQGGYFAMPDGGLEFHGELAAAQVLYDVKAGDWSWRLSGAAYLMDGEPGAEFARAVGNERDYRIGEMSVQARSSWRELPVSIGADLFHNFESYDGSDATEAAFGDDRTGFGIGASLGQNKQRGDWRLRYNFAYVEELAVNPAMAQDTLSRIGTSNIRSHDFRFYYSILDNLTIMPRIALTEQISGDRDGYRFRIDLKYWF